jgi:hypothetical protein
LKAAGRLGKDEREFAVLRPKGLTEAERGDARQFAPGMVVQFHQNAKGFKRGERVTVTAGDREKVEVRRKDGSIAALRLGEVNKFQLYEEARLRLAAGDKLRITQNGFTQETRRGLLKSGGDRLNNGAIYEVAGFTRNGDIRLTNGFTIQKDYGGPRTAMSSPPMVPKARPSM